MDIMELYFKWKLFQEMAPVVFCALIAIFLILLFVGAAIMDLLYKFKKSIEKEDSDNE